MNIAQGSLEEVRYYLILARDLKYTTDQNLMPPLEEVSRLLESYMQAIERNNQPRATWNSSF